MKRRGSTNGKSGFIVLLLVCSNLLAATAVDFSLPVQTGMLTDELLTNDAPAVPGPLNAGRSFLSGMDGACCLPSYSALLAPFPPHDGIAQPLAAASAPATGDYRRRLERPPTACV